MSELNFNPNLEEFTLSFEPQFEELVGIYHGLKRAYIGEGIQQTNDDNGVLYVVYQNDEVQRLGPVSSYYYALQSGFTGTFSEWVQTILDAGPNAISAAASAASATTEAGNAATSATNASTSESNAATSESNAANSALVAENWATGSGGGTPSQTNNAKAYSETSNEYALQSESWAVGTRNGTTDTVRTGASTDNAKYYAESAQTSAEKAEYSMEKYPRVGNNDTWELWNPSTEQYQDSGHESLANATVTCKYQNSTSGIIHPDESSTDWSTSPHPEEGKYLWIQIIHTWNNGTVNYAYAVSYIGVNGTGSVDSVNGLSGRVILDGRNIYMDSSLPNADQEAIYQAFDRISTPISNAEIDALFT